MAKDAGLAVLVEVVGAESTKDSPKNRDRVAAKLSKPNLDVLLSTSATTHGLLRGEFSYNGKLVTFSKKSEARKAEADTGVEEDEVLNVPPVKDAEEVKVEPEVIVEAADEEVLDVPPVNLNKGFSKMKEQFEDIQAPLMFASLPRLALLDGVRTTGNVVFVSVEARVWFSPLWAQEKLTEVSQVPHMKGFLRNNLSGRSLTPLLRGTVVWIQFNHKRGCSALQGAHELTTLFLHSTL